MQTSAADNTSGQKCIVTWRLHAVSQYEIQLLAESQTRPCPIQRTGGVLISLSLAIEPKGGTTARAIITRNVRHFLQIFERLVTLTFCIIYLTF